jgi:hypothetical protein
MITNMINNDPIAHLQHNSFASEKSPLIFLKTAVDAKKHTSTMFSQHVKMLEDLDLHVHTKVFFSLGVSGIHNTHALWPTWKYIINSINASSYTNKQYWSLTSRSSSFFAPTAVSNSWL